VTKLAPVKVTQLTFVCLSTKLAINFCILTDIYKTNNSQHHFCKKTNDTNLKAVESRNSYFVLWRQLMNRYF